MKKIILVGFFVLILICFVVNSNGQGSIPFYDSLPSNPCLIRSLWIDFDKSSNNAPDEEIQDCYYRLRSLISLAKISQLAKMAIFTKGPHKNNQLKLDSNTFGYYNKDFVIWLRNNMVPGASDPDFKEKTQMIYDTFFKKIGRSFYLSYLKLHSNSAEFGKMKERYMKIVCSDDDQGCDSNEKQYWMSVDPIKRFWVRRAIDETDVEFFNGLVLILKTYDKDALKLN